MTRSPTQPRLVRARRRGNYALLTALSSSVFLGFGALALDSAYIRVADLQAQAAADAGAHAALVRLRVTGDIELARDAAVAVINANTILGKSAEVDAAADITFGEWDFASDTFDGTSTVVNAVEVTVRKTASSANGSIDLLMMKMFGDATAEAAARDRAIGALRFREIMIAQDVTGSFRDEIGDARDANLLFLDYLYENPNPNDKIGMATFVGGGEAWTELQLLSDNYATIRSQWETLDWCNRNYSPWTSYPVPTYHNAPQMMNCNVGASPASPRSDSGTHQGKGIDSALDELLGGAADPEALKTIVLVSDGKPECVPSSTSCNASRALQGRLSADDAEDNGVSIFSVSYNNPYNASQSAYMESLIRGYGAFYETLDSADLPGILYEIAQAVPVALVK
jgi:Flp pilus assembly protein TadG